MKKWLVLLCIFAFTAPVVADGLDLGADGAKGAVYVEILYPGDVYTSASMLSDTVWDDYDVWIFFCDGSGLFEGEVEGGFWGETMIYVLYEYGVGLVEFDYGTTVSFSSEVTDMGLYYVLAGVVSTPGAFPAIYFMDASFTGFAGECTPPPYNPEKWNDGGYIQYNNNCYNYANDERTDTFAQPGRASGCYPWSLNCPNVYDAAECDGLVGISSGTDPCPGDMHRVYLVTAPGWDYHWYREDTDGMWSHKPGGTPATNRDGSGQLIPNPEYADIGMYTDRCGYMCACGDNADIY